MTVIEKIGKNWSAYVKTYNRIPRFILMSNENLSLLKTETKAMCYFEIRNNGYYFENMEICVRTTNSNEIILL